MVLEALIEQGDLSFSGNLEKVRMPLSDVLNEVSGLKGTGFCSAERVKNFFVNIMAWLRRPLWMTAARGRGFGA
jgi:hypothetical protein